MKYQAFKDQFSRHYKRVFQVTFVVLHVVGFIHGTIGKYVIYMNLPNTNNKIVTFINCISDVLLVLPNVYPLMYSWRRTCTKVDNQKRCLKMCMAVLFIKILGSIPIAINAHFMLSVVGWNMYKFHIARDVGMGGLHYIISAYCYDVLSSKHDLEDWNNALIKLGRSFESINSVGIMVGKAECEIKLNFPIKPQQKKYLEKLKAISRNYHFYYDGLVRFNTSSKPLLILIAICNSTNIFHALTILIEFGIKSKIINNVDISRPIYTIYSMWIIVTLTQAALMAWVGEELEVEGKRTAGICYTLLNKLAANPRIEKEHRQIEKQVNFILDQSMDSHVGMDAGGFFRLNWGIVALYVTTAVTYSIVIIQYLLK